MPVRFSCSECGQRLNARDDKIGKTLKCPKCRTQLVVPSVEAAEAHDPTRDALKQLEEAVGEDDDVSELVVYDDDSEQSTARTSDFDRELVSVSRRVIYVQAGLLLALALFGLTVGFLIGRGTAPQGDGVDDAPQVTTASRVPGKLQYATGEGLRPDRGAVVLAVPADSKPEEKIPVEDLLPQSQMPAAGNLALQQLATLGGDYTRADDAGNFALYLTPGRYHLLYISYAARRPGGNQVARQDFAEIGAYVTSGYDLIGQHRYQFQTVDVRLGARLDHTFSRD
ncbi:MAG: hypothetical protein WEA31_07460 [Pirellulales bacterium]